MKQKQRSFFQMNDERFRQMMVFLIVTVALFTSLVLLIQNEAGMRTNVFRRDANRYAVQAMRVRSTGETRAGYAWNVAYQSWLEMGLLASAAEKAGDPSAAERYRNVQEQIARHSPLLEKKYFGEKQNEPHIEAYEADSYLVEATALSERAATWFVVGEVWDGKADANITYLSLLAVALALYGLAAALAARVRWIFMMSGSLIFLVTSYFTIETFLKPVPVISEPAIDAYARGVGSAYRGDVAGAIKAFDEALAAKNDYANAYYDRGYAFYKQGALDKAIENYEAAKKNGRDDTAVNFDLGWAYYLQGNFENAIKANQRALEFNANHAGARMNLALAQLAAGKADDARKEYAAAMDSAAKQVADAQAAGKAPPASLWVALDDGASDLESLFARAQNRDTEGTAVPPREMIKDANAITRAAPDLIKQLKNLELALEYTSRPPSGTTRAKIGALKFGVSDGRAVKFADQFPTETKAIVVAFDYSEMENGKTMIVRVYQDGEEDSSLRLVSKWEVGASGKTEIEIGAGYSGVFSFPPGEYLVEVYVDYQWVQSGSFVVQ